MAANDKEIAFIDIMALAILNTHYCVFTEKLPQLSQRAFKYQANFRNQVKTQT